VLWAGTLLTIATLGLDSLRLLPFGRSVPLAPWMYGLFWFFGLLIAAWRLDRRREAEISSLRASIRVLEEQLDREPIIMRHRDFTTRYEPEFVRQGFRVIYPQPSGVHEKELEGWVQAKTQDSRGKIRPAAIGDNPQAIHLIPMIRRDQSSSS